MRAKPVKTWPQKMIEKRELPISTTSILRLRKLLPSLPAIELATWGPRSPGSTDVHWATFCLSRWHVAAFQRSTQEGRSSGGR